MPAGTALFRARQQPKGKKYATPGSLGPPPTDHAIKTNRISPPGVVMTYAAEDRDTALAETADEEGAYAVGEFTNDRELLILDTGPFQNQQNRDFWRTSPTIESLKSSLHEWGWVGARPAADRWHSTIPFRNTESV
jgi:RES domain